MTKKRFNILWNFTGETTGMESFMATSKKEAMEMFWDNVTDLIDVYENVDAEVE